jgi:hypothetical protein
VIPISSLPGHPIESLRVLSLTHDPQHHQWITPSWNTVGKPTRIGFFPTAKTNNNDLLVVNNLIDALTAVTLQHPAVAVLSHGEMHSTTVLALRQLAGSYQLRICYPTASADQHAATTLLALLNDITINTLTLNDNNKDLNHWHRLRQSKQH